MKYSWYGCICFALSSLVACSAPQSLSPEQVAAQNQQLMRFLEQTTKSLRVGSLDDALASAQLAQELAPEDPRVVDALGCIAWRRGEYRVAREAFVRAIELEPSYDRAYAHLALVAERDGDLDAARELLVLALQLNPMNYRARNNYAVLLKQEGNRTEAFHQLLRAYHSGAKREPLIHSNLQSLR